MTKGRPKRRHTAAYLRRKRQEAVAYRAVRAQVLASCQAVWQAKTRARIRAICLRCDDKQLEQMRIEFSMAAMKARGLNNSAARKAELRMDVIDDERRRRVAAPFELRRSK